MAPIRGTWLSLFAMLMIFIGPLVSQAMPMGQGHAMPMNMSMDMGSSMHGHGCEEDSGTVDKSGLHPIWEKCGYCSLFFHSPALASAPAFLPAAAPQAILGEVPHTLDGHARQAVFPGAMSRAPPSFSRV
ncbi:MAG: DUF2946 domain-containing protein [Pseudomonas sp.]|uniref:DUF2946 domain-containing protein n=1 Tax=Pseudomonas abieticivorans TaxID=2931382 RepID=UPI0020BF6F59|nr:DUF2946 domain-containing protein [Pseudomonas sp. PIA16]MDE1165800.1 DUF2946 domain-containing protein [Pseudomonas sp.]